MFNKKTIHDINCKNKTVLVRVDYNVPMSDGVIQDDYRIRQSLPTLNYLISQHCKLVLIAHLGRPDGRVDKQYSLEPVARRLSKLIDQKVLFANDCIGSAVDARLKQLRPGGILLLENLRFHPEEESNDPAFAKALASGMSLFVQDGFGVVHRAHASTDAILPPHWVTHG